MSAPFDPRPDRLAIALAGFACAAVAVLALVRESSPGWEGDQARVREIVASRLGEAAAAKVPRGLQQVWIPELSRVDRCTTCHATIDWGPELLVAENPARSHPRPDLIAKHPIERFGCTLCHGGQGWATTKEAAHGEVEHWGEPVLTSAVAKRYDLTQAEMLETRCAACHRGLAPFPEMPLLDEAKAVVLERKCQRCHFIEGSGKRIAPDLSKVGDAPPEHLHFPAGWNKPRTAMRWHLEHFKDPTKVVPVPTLPNGEPDPDAVVMDLKVEELGALTDREAAALALLVLSWRTLPLPPAWTPRPAASR